nr:hypothetical protein [Deinobacterium chartae]
MQQPLSYTVTAKPDWLTVTPEQGTATPDAPLQVRASATCPETPQVLQGQVSFETQPRLPVERASITLICNPVPGDTTPEAFSFEQVNGAAPGSTVDSNEIIVSGINVPVTLTVQGGQILLNGALQAATSLTVHSGDRIRVRVVASSAAGGERIALVNIGGVSAAFVVITETPPPVGALQVSPAQLDFTAVGPEHKRTLWVTKDNSTASISASSSNCEGIVSYTPASARAPQAAFQVTPLKAGACYLTFRVGAESVNALITVTTTDVVVE